MRSSVKALRAPAHRSGSPFVRVRQREAPPRHLLVLGPALLFVAVLAGCLGEEIVEPETGRLEIQIVPDDIGAEWTLESRQHGTRSGLHGEILRGLPAGEYVVRWSEVQGWEAPSPNPTVLHLDDDAAATVTGRYNPKKVGIGTIVIGVQPSGLDAPWTVTGPKDFYLEGTGSTTLDKRAGGDYQLVWGEVSGYITPDPVAIELFQKEIVEVVGIYEPGSGPQGTVVVDADPDELNAAWTLTGPDGFLVDGSGDRTFTGRASGTYAVTWKPAAGHETPPPQEGVLSEGETLLLQGTYVVSPLPVGTLRVDPNPDHLNAAWTVSKGEDFVHPGQGDEVLTIEPGDYTVQWHDVTGWRAPAAQSAWVGADQTVTFVGDYVEEPTASVPVLPVAADWTDHGEIFREGSPGDWDRYLWGAFTATAVKRDGKYYLYYQGAEDYSEPYGTVTYRSIGVATSEDGVRFQKYAGNPVLNWLPNDALEEGAVSGGAWVAPGGDVEIYYGANTAISSTQVNADGRFASSSDGFSFSDGGVALDHANSSVWGYGDEVFPILGFREKDRWVCYYLPNGSPQKRILAAAWGSGPTALDRSAQALSAGSAVGAWGPAGWARLSESRYAIFLSSQPDAHDAGDHVDAYLVDPASPASLTGPVRIYGFSNMTKATILLDQESQTWFMYYRNADYSAYGVRTAPVRYE